MVRPNNQPVAIFERVTGSGLRCARKNPPFRAIHHGRFLTFDHFDRFDRLDHFDHFPRFEIRTSHPVSCLFHEWMADP